VPPLAWIGAATVTLAFLHYPGKRGFEAEKKVKPILYMRHSLSLAVIRQAIRVCFRIILTIRDAEEPTAERRVELRRDALASPVALAGTRRGSVSPAWH